MPRVLYIECSPRQEKSASSAVAQAFLESYKKLNPDAQILKLDLWEIQLPEFNHHLIDAKYAILSGQEPVGDERDAWRDVEDLISEFKSADKYIISLPMWNFGIPYKLKHYIDLIVQPSYTFSYTSAEGYKGLVVGKSVMVVYSRGALYTAEMAIDFQIPYMDNILKFIGFTDIRKLLVESTMTGPETVAKAVEEAKVMAEKF